MSPAVYLVSAAAPETGIVQVCVSRHCAYIRVPNDEMTLDLYYQAFPNDRRFTKGLVYTVYLIELVAIIFNSLVVNSRFYGPNQAAFISQSFYAYRVYVLSKSLLIPCLIVVISLTSSVAAFVTGAFVLQGVWTFPSLPVFGQKGHRIQANKGLGIPAHSLDHRDRLTGWYFFPCIRINDPSPPAAAGVAVVANIVSVAFPRNDYFSSPVVILPGLYANTILVVLNSRMKITGGPRTETSSDIVSTIPLHFRSTAPNAGTEQSFVIEIRRAVSDANVHNQVEIKVMDVYSILDPSIN
ncbi:hypothetical protein DFH07DRAFT_780357 [Mycena maculata]|uniref:Uncharacterized protein n=1 Tax=Mycena maculata TaxID=230809 RepID=A0AAD7I535_9AGAR|nr:hypothetical protein DFH07DRAFT_780357 [Mycena maculata]